MPKTNSFCSESDSQSGEGKLRLSLGYWEILTVYRKKWKKVLQLQILEVQINL